MLRKNIIIINYPVISNSSDNSDLIKMRHRATSIFNLDSSSCVQLLFFSEGESQFIEESYRTINSSKYSRVRSFPAQKNTPLPASKKCFKKYFITPYNVLSIRFIILFINEFAYLQIHCDLTCFIDNAICFFLTSNPIFPRHSDGAEIGSSNDERRIEISFCRLIDSSFRRTQGSPLHV